jgi:hypothetical protein
MMNADPAREEFSYTGCGNEDVNVQEGIQSCLQMKRKFCGALEPIEYSPVFAAG